MALSTVAPSGAGGVKIVIKMAKFEGNFRIFGPLTGMRSLIDLATGSYGLV